ncbi:MAG: hypothetical protein H7Y43_16395 [Akkermansiaceae bacterium]|nr:hypothetical protein [Verrucomicrobiales bacterium]
MIEQRKARGCLFYTGIAVAIAAAVLITASYIGYRYARGLIAEFSDTQSMPVPTVQLSETDLNRVRERVMTFSRAVEQGTAVEPLSLTADDVNALIVGNSNLVTVRGKLFISGMEGTNVLAQLSVPAEDLGFKPLQGRYVNATGQFTVGFSNGVLNVNAQSLSAKDKPFPDTFMGRIRPQNFAYRLNNDPDGKAALARLEDVRIEGGRLIVVPKR